MQCLYRIESTGIGWSLLENPWCIYLAALRKSRQIAKISLDSDICWFVASTFAITGHCGEHLGQRNRYIYIMFIFWRHLVIEIKIRNGKLFLSLFLHQCSVVNSLPLQEKALGFNIRYSLFVRLYDHSCMRNIWPTSKYKESPTMFIDKVYSYKKEGSLVAKYQINDAKFSLPSLFIYHFFLPLPTWSWFWYLGN